MEVNGIKQPIPRYCARCLHVPISPNSFLCRTQGWGATERIFTPIETVRRMLYQLSLSHQPFVEFVYACFRRGPLAFILLTSSEFCLCNCYFWVFSEISAFFPWYGNVATFSYFGDHGQHVDEICLGDTPLWAGSKRHGSVGDQEQGAAISLTYAPLLAWCQRAGTHATIRGTH
jgi:hypothetical protein